VTAIEAEKDGQRCAQSGHEKISQDQARNVAPQRQRRRCLPVLRTAPVDSSQVDFRQLSIGLLKSLGRISGELLRRLGQCHSAHSRWVRWAWLNALARPYVLWAVRGLRLVVRPLHFAQRSPIGRIPDLEV
jgi:hypothetical protein